MKITPRPEQTHSVLVRPLNEKIIARPRIVVEMPFSLRLPAAAPAASAADALCVMRLLSAAGLTARGLFAGCKTRCRSVKSSECKAHSRHLTRKSCCKLERRTMKLLCALLVTFRRCIRYRCECNRRACIMRSRLGDTYNTTLYVVWPMYRLSTSFTSRVSRCTF